MPLIADLIHVPEQIHQGDFVLKLTEGVEHEEETLRSYVVTPQLARSFDQALALIQSSVEGGRSKGAYLHGSFGSGKSHFMAVLALLLEGNTQARSIPELADVVRRHVGWMEGKRFLLVPYHLIGATSLEAAVLGQYAEFVRKEHPGAPTPGFYRAEKLFRDASALRDKMGDDRFFEELGAGSQDGQSGWGALDTAWDAESFEAAIAAEPGSEDRSRLVGDLVDTFFSAQRDLAETQDEGFVSLDEGLVILARHAQSLGYDAVVLFLDELILWLASHAADQAFINREAQKLVKLVEARRMDRPIPLVSFIARQRDLREMVGDHLPGAEKLNFSHRLDHMEGRFDTITLEDRNLPAIVAKRLLRPQSDEAKEQLKEAFEQTTRVREEVLNTLLTREGDRAMFAQVYPFSPALIQTLVALSSLLQRERTALKLLVQLLVDQRAHLKLGDLVPVGDLYDVIAAGDEPFSQAMKQRFETAKKLYRDKLLPVLERQHEVTREDLAAGRVPDEVARAFRNDARLAKTLILAALADGVEALKALTPARLAALNHGTVRSPIPGQETALVLSRVQQWAAQVGEIKVSSDDRNPTIAVQLVGVDTEGILENAKTIDNTGNRIRKVRDLLFEMAGIEQEDSLLPPKVKRLWRGTPHSFEVLFANVRELREEQFAPQDAPWRIVVDYPFDDPGYTPRDDFAKLQQYPRDEPTQTLVWLPNFLKPAALDELGRLVVLDHVLNGGRLEEYGGHLSQADREQARVILKNQRDQVRQRIKNVLLAAYGISTLNRGAVDETHELETHVYALDRSLDLQPPVGASFGEALGNLFSQALRHQYPAHPEFEGEVKPSGVRRVWEVIQQAAQTPDRRLEITRADRAEVLRIAVPLKLGEMGEAHFVLSRAWLQAFEQERARADADTVTVGQLRQWMDRPRPKGLPKIVGDLLIASYALLTNRSFVLHGHVIEPDLGSLRPEVELQEQALPSESVWQEAVSRLGSVLGRPAPAIRNASGVAQLVERARDAADKHEGAVGVYKLALDAHVDSAEGDQPPRVQTARALHDLLAALRSASPDEVVQTLAEARVATSSAAMGTVLERADTLAAALASTKWDLLEEDEPLPSPHGERAAAVRVRVREALSADEHVIPLANVLASAVNEMISVLREAAQTANPTPPARDEPSPKYDEVVNEDPKSQTVEDGQVRVSAGDIESAFEQVRQAIAERPGHDLELNWRLVPKR